MLIWVYLNFIYSVHLMQIYQNYWLDQISLVYSVHQWATQSECGVY